MNRHQRALALLTIGLVTLGAAGNAALAKGEPPTGKPLFVRTTDRGVAIRVARVDVSDVVGTAPCQGTGCPPPECQARGAIAVGFSTEAAVGQGWAELYRGAGDRLRAAGAGFFGFEFGAPAAWVVVQTGPGVDRVRATFADGGSDAMKPRHHLAVLASPLRHPKGLSSLPSAPAVTVVALDRRGGVVGRVRLDPNRPIDSQPTRCAGGLEPDFPAKKGAPPADEAAARTAITIAFTVAYQPVLEPEDRVALIEDGPALLEVMKLAATRFSQYRDRVAARVEEVRFVDATHAAVRFGLTLDDGTEIVPPGVGRAVLVNATWLVSRDTFCRLLQLSGVYCPARAKAA